MARRSFPNKSISQDANTEGSAVRLDRGSDPGSPRGALRVELREEAGACGGQLALRLEDPLRRDANVIVGLQGLLDEAAE